MTNPVQRIVTCEITHLEMLEMKPPIPLSVQVRIKLNKHGFEFEDDNKASLVTNEAPNPLGKITCWEDYETGSVHYKQILNT